MNDEITKDDVSNWATVATYVATYPGCDRDGAADVDVQIGESEGLWFVRTTDDAGGDDDADDTVYGTEEEATAAAEAFAAANDEGDGKSAEQYLTDLMEEEASAGEDPEGEFALYWETSLDDEGERTRYSTYAAAVAAAELSQSAFDAANPSGGGVTYLCGFSVRRLVDGEWVRCDETGEVEYP
jgi:hypothetical protein